MNNQTKPIIFSDFDGTITKRNVIVMIMEKFAPPEWEVIKDKILLERSLTLKDGVEKLFSLVESKKKSEIIDFVIKEVQLRDGFSNFLDFCKNKDIEFNVLSGGLDFFIEAVLDNFKNKLNIFCNKGDFKQEKIGIEYKYLPKSCMTCGDCGCCKIEVIDRYPKNQFQRILIGDGLTDLAAAKMADLVFARSDLVEYLEKEKVNYIPYNDFYEVKEQLVQKHLTKN